MNNPVVTTIAEAYALQGYTTLCFNFRGVGASQGAFDNGRGEQSDVLAAMAFLAGKGVTEIHLAGYSFGAWVNANLTAAGADVHRMVMVSPPVAFLEFAGDMTLPQLDLVVCGDQDAFAPSSMLGPAVRQWHHQARLEFIPQCDHFYSNGLRSLRARLTAHLEN